MVSTPLEWPNRSKTILRLTQIKLQPLRLPKTQSLLTNPSFSDPQSFSVPEASKGDLFSSPVQRLQSVNQFVPLAILAGREKNLVRSRLLRCPTEVAYQIHLYLDGVDLMNLSHTCHAFLNFYSPKEWYGRFMNQFPSWSYGSRLDDESDQGCMSLYKKSFTSDAFMRRRLGAPPPIVLSASTNQTSNVTRLTVESMDICSLPEHQEPDGIQSPKEDVAPMDVCNKPEPHVPDDVQAHKDDVVHASEDVFRAPEEDAFQALEDVVQAPNEDVDEMYFHEHDQSTIRVMLNEGKFYPSDAETDDGHWSRVASPVYSTDLKSKTTLAGSLVARPIVNGNGKAALPANAAEQQVFDFKVLLHAIPDLTQSVAVLTSDLWTADQPGGGSWSSPFAPKDLPVVQLVELKHFPMAESTLPGSKRRRSSRPEMRVLVTLAFGQNVGEQDMLLLDVWRLIKVIEVFIPCISTSTTVDPGVGSHSRSASSSSSSSSVQPLGHVRLGRTETIKISTNDDMRCRVVKIYSAVVSIKSAYDIQKALIQSQSQSQSALISAHIQASTCASLIGGDPMFASFQSMNPAENNGPIPDNPGVVGKCPLGAVKDKMVTIECIAIFGIQNSETSSAMVARKILFTSRERTVGLTKTLGDASWDKRTLSRGVSCMTLFPYYSGYERFLVMFNRYGRGMIWDWVNECQVAQLRMPSDVGVKDGKIVKQNSQAEGNPASSQAIPSSGAFSLQTQEQSSATDGEGDREVSPVANPNRWLSYWGAQVSFTETPDPFKMDVKKSRSFRIVILADGRNDEWESTWWHVDGDSLGLMDHTFDQHLFVPTGSKARVSKNISGTRVVYAIGKRYEDQTIGIEFRSKKHQNQMGQIATPLNSAPLRFNAYVVWNRYRISLTADRGLVMVDLEKKGSKERNATEDSEWVTYLENSLGKVLVDIATVNNSLVVTLKDGHLVWSFFPARTIPAEPKKVEEVVETLDARVFTKANMKRPTKRRKPHTPRDPFTLDAEASVRANATDKKTKPSKSDTSKEFKAQNAKKRQNKRGTPRTPRNGKGIDIKGDPSIDLFGGEMDSGPLGIGHYQY